MVVPEKVYESFTNIRYLSSVRSEAVSLSHLVTLRVSCELEPSPQESDLSKEILSPLYGSTTDINSPDAGLIYRLPAVSVNNKSPVTSVDFCVNRLESNPITPSSFKSSLNSDSAFIIVDSELLQELVPQSICPELST